MLRPENRSRCRGNSISGPVVDNEPEGRKDPGVLGAALPRLRGVTRNSMHRMKVQRNV